MFDVYLYIEARALITGIEANTPEEAAQKARDIAEAQGERLTLVPCNGRIFAALVDTQGDENRAKSVNVEFEQPTIEAARNSEGL